jgi:hypothetical protein
MAEVHFNSGMPGGTPSIERFFPSIRNKGWGTSQLGIYV